MTPTEKTCSQNEEKSTRPDDMSKASTDELLKSDKLVVSINERSPEEIAEGICTERAQNYSDCYAPGGFMQENEIAFLAASFKDAVADAIRAERAKNREIVWPSEEEIITKEAVLVPFNGSIGKTSFKFGFSLCASWLRKRTEELNRGK